jgi:signal peptidase
VVSGPRSDTIADVHAAPRFPARTARSRRRVLARAAVAAVAALAALWLAFLRPAFLGGTTTYVVVSGSSMEPTLHDRDLVVVRERGSYGTDDVIAFRLPAGTAGPEEAVIHRIVGGSAAEGFVTRGDNRDADDPWRVAPDDILGRRIAHVPRVGVVLDWLAKPMVIGLMVGAALASLYWTFRIHVAREQRATSKAPAAHRATGTPMPARAPACTAAARIRERYERADPDTRIRIRQLVFEQAIAFKSEDPDFDTAAFLRACGAHAYDRR